MFGINKFWIWILSLVASMYLYNINTTIVVFILGIMIFIYHTGFNKKPALYTITIEEDSWVKSVTPENGITTVIVTDGDGEEIHNFTTSKVLIVGNTISIG